MKKFPRDPGFIMTYETQFLVALGTTEVIEVPILAALIRFLYQDKTLPLSRIIWIGLLCNALSLPYLWFVFPSFIDPAYCIVVGESVVTVVEAVILWKVLGLNWKEAGVCSIIMNLASYSFGHFLYSFF